MAKKEMKEVVDPSSSNEELDADHGEPRVYELGFHIDSELSAEEVKKVYAGIRTAVEKAGTIVAEGTPRKVSLAYTVSRMEHGGRRDYDQSNFAWIAYEANGEGHRAAQSAVQSESRVFRFIDLRSDKEAARHASELHEILVNALEKRGDQELTEEVSDTDIDQALKEVGV